MLTYNALILFYVTSVPDYSFGCVPRKSIALLMNVAMMSRAKVFELVRIRTFL